MVPANFSFHKIEDVKDLFNPFFINEFNKEHIDKGGIELLILDDGAGDSLVLATGESICKMKRDIVSMYAATIVQPFDVGCPPKKQASRNDNAIYNIQVWFFDKSNAIL